MERKDDQLLFYGDRPTKENLYLYMPLNINPLSLTFLLEEHVLQSCTIAEPFQLFFQRSSKGKNIVLYTSICQPELLKSKVYPRTLNNSLHKGQTLNDKMFATKSCQQKKVIDKKL